MKFLSLILLVLPLNAQRAATVAVSAQPSIFYSVGGGALTHGHGGTFTYWSVSKYLGQNSYATIINEYTISQGQVLTCPLAGVSHVATQFGPVSIGLTGAGGGCSGDKGGASGAATAQGFVNFHLYNEWNLILSVRETFTNRGDDAIKVSLGLGWGK
jgi:hypothetical protein